MGAAVVGSVVVILLGLALLGCVAAGPSLARAMMRRAALWWHSELDPPGVLAEEWESLIDQRPVVILKLITALLFLTGAVLRHGVFAARPFARDCAWILGRFAAGCVRMLRVLLLGWHRCRPRRGARLAYVAVLLFLLSALVGQWVVLGAAVLTACVSRSFTRAEKGALVIVIPMGTSLLYTVGFWLNRNGYWGGHIASTADLLSGAASFFGTLPRTAALLGALFLAWRLARRGVQEQME